MDDLPGVNPITAARATVAAGYGPIDVDPDVWCSRCGHTCSTDGDGWWCEGCGGVWDLEGMPTP